MTEEQIREIIRDELYWFIKADRFTFNKIIQILDGRNIQLAKGTGTNIGTETTQKLGFYGVTPVDQPATVSDPDAEVASLAAAVAAIIDRLQETGLIA